MITATGVVGDIPFFCHRPMPFDAVAQHDTTVVELRTQALLELLRASSSLSLRWITSIASRLETAQRRMLTVLGRSLVSQVATILLEHRIRTSDGWAVLLTHDTIAQLLGARWQSVSRVMTELKNAGLVEASYRRIDLLDLRRLGDIAGEELEKIPCGQTMAAPG